MVKGRKYFGLIGTLFLVTNLMVSMIWAAAPGTIVSSETDGGQVVLYVNGLGEAESIRCQIGTSICDDLNYAPIADQEVSVSTYLLIDNSLSVSAKYRPMITEIMNNLAANRMSGEQITVATFSDKINYLIEDSRDYLQLKQCIDGITYVDQETYLTDVLYELLTGWKNNAEPGFKRVIIVSDGVDNKAVGYTKEELYGFLKEQPYPIYTLGCASTGGSNNEELKNMFALSRMTSASFWLMEEVSDSLTVVNAVAQDNDVWRVAVNPPAELCDGSSRAVKLSITVGGQETNAVISVVMPFIAIAKESSVPETEPVKETPAVTGSLEPENFVSAMNPEPDNRKQQTLFIYIAIAAGALIAAAILVFIIIRVRKKRNEENEFEAAPEDAFHQAAVRADQLNSAADVTEMVSAAGGEATSMIFPERQGTTVLVLTDLKQLTRIQEIPLDRVITIGRSSVCDVVLDYDKSVSKKHCEISFSQGQLKVKDLGSLNKTKVDEAIVNGEELVYNGSILTLGNVNLKVEVRR